MCTLTMVTYRAGHERGLRVVCNRDERRSRAEALPPVIVALGEAWVCYPVNPESGGTWIGSSSAGFVVALINVNLAPVASAALPLPRASRGGIPVRLLSAKTFEEACRFAGAIEATRYAPFRVVVSTLSHWVEWVSDGERLLSRAGRHALGTPLLRTSSSFGRGDVEVIEPRRTLWSALLRSHADPREAQDAFHAHAFEHDGARSVLMTRQDARTVSRVAIVLSKSGDSGAPSLTYTAIQDSSDAQTGEKGAAPAREHGASRRA